MIVEKPDHVLRTVCEAEHPRNNDHVREDRRNRYQIAVFSGAGKNLPHRSGSQYFQRSHREPPRRQGSWQAASDKESRNCRRGKVRKYAEKLRDPKLDRSKAGRQEHHRQHHIDRRDSRPVYKCQYRAVCCVVFHIQFLL